MPFRFVRALGFILVAMAACLQIVPEDTRPETVEFLPYYLYVSGLALVLGASLFVDFEAIERKAARYTDNLLNTPTNGRL